MVPAPPKGRSQHKIPRSPMTDRQNAKKKTEAEPEPAPADIGVPDLAVVVEYQRIEITRVLRDNDNLRQDIDRMLRLIEREQIIRQQDQQDRGAMLAVVDRLTVERSLPAPGAAPADQAVEGRQGEDALPPPHDFDTAPEEDDAKPAEPDDAEPAEPDDAGRAEPDDIETSLAELKEICELLEMVREHKGGEPPPPGTEEPSGQPEIPAVSQAHEEELIALLQRLDQLNPARRGSRPAGGAKPSAGPGKASAKTPATTIKRALRRIAGYLERRP